jgi:hypothetical protein
VLLVRGGRLDRHRAALELADEPDEPLLLAFRIALVLLAQARGQQRADAAPDQEIRDEAALEKLHGK